MSARNPRVRRLARMARRPDERAAQQAVVVEGPVLLGAALAGGAGVIEVFVDEGSVQGDASAVAEVLDRLGSDVEVWSLPAGTLDRVGDAVTSQGIVGVVVRTDPAWPTPANAPFVLVLDGVADPGNVGTLVRAAAAVGGGCVVVAGGADPTAPKVVRASAGAVFAVDVLPVPSALTAVENLLAAGYRVLASTVAGGRSHHLVDVREPVAIVVGNEARGVSAEVLEAASARVTIEMAGPMESLNAAMAGTVLCFEVARRRGQDDQAAQGQVED